MNNNRLRLLSYVVIGYMLLAFAWWTILLNTKNEEAYTANKEMLRVAMMANGTYTTEAEFRQTERYTNLKDRYKRRQFMIFGESLVFVMSLFIGFWLINKGYRDIIKNSRSKTNFLLSISHELKSPVASIKLALETIRKRELQKNQLDKIAEGALSETERLKTLISNLLLAAKLEEPYRIHKEVVKTDEMLRQIIGIEQVKFPEADIILELSPEVEIVSTDKFAFGTILHNLVENALKYSDDKPFVKVALFREGADLKIEVADRGIGVPDSEKERIFEKFYRLGQEITRKTKGTGLGLFIIHRMVSALNGKIWVEDNDPKGSVFKVSLKNHIVPTIE
jgi:signal transduction histidine kinase